MKSVNKIVFGINEVGNVKIINDSSQKFEMNGKHSDGSFIIPYRCKLSFCNKVFLNKSEYDAHVYTHSGLKPVTCKICEKSFVSTKVFERHECCKGKQNRRKTFTCTECGQVFHYKGTFILHKRSHDQVKPYTCGVCNKSFMLKGTLYKHMMSHVFTYKCNTCEKTCMSARQLDQHMLMHVDKIASYKCIYCKRFFRQHEPFEKHIRYHLTNEWRRELEAKKRKYILWNFDTETSETENSETLKTNVESRLKEVDDEDESLSFIIQTPDTSLHSLDSNVMEETSKFQCILCNSAFENVSLFMQHVNSHQKNICEKQTSIYMPSTFTTENQSTTINSKQQSACEDKIYVVSGSVDDRTDERHSVLRSSDSTGYEKKQDDCTNTSTLKNVQPNHAITKCKSVYVCRCCGKKFASQNFVKEHLMLFVEIDSFKTDQKHKEFIEQMTTDCVVNEETVESFISTVSTTCLKNFDLDSYLLAEKPVTFYCDICNADFHDQFSLVRHMNTCNEFKFQCQDCNINYENNQRLKLHNLLVHQKEPGHSGYSDSKGITSPWTVNHKISNSVDVTVQNTSMNDTNLDGTKSQHFESNHDLNLNVIKSPPLSSRNKSDLKNTTCLQSTRKNESNMSDIILPISGSKSESTLGDITLQLAANQNESKQVVNESPGPISENELNQVVSASTVSRNRNESNQVVSASKNKNESNQVVSASTGSGNRNELNRVVSASTGCGNRNESNQVVRAPTGSVDRNELDLDDITSPHTANKYISELNDITYPCSTTKKESNLNSESNKKSDLDITPLNSQGNRKSNSVYIKSGKYKIKPKLKSVDINMPHAGNLEKSDTKCTFSTSSKLVKLLRSKDIMKGSCSEARVDMWSCRRCEVTFQSIQVYLSHMKEKHNTDCTTPANAEFVCAHCNKSFLSQAQLFRHLKDHKQRLKSRNKTPIYSNVMRHDSVNHKWVCLICDQTFTFKSNLTRHITLHDQKEKKEHQCPFCNRVFQFQRYLQHHVMYMHRTEEEKKYSCVVCEAQLTTPQSLKRHMTLHTGEIYQEKNHECGYCGAKFKCKVDLNVHIRIHTGERPFPCEICSHRFNTLWNLQRHLKTHEDSESVPPRETPENSDCATPIKRRRISSNNEQT